MKKIILLFGFIAFTLSNFGQGIDRYDYLSPAYFGTIHADTVSAVGVVELTANQVPDSLHTRALVVTGTSNLHGANLGTSQSLVGTTAMTIGSGAQTIHLYSSGWEITAAGAASGLTTISATGTINGLTIANGIANKVTTATATAHTDSTNATSILTGASQFVSITSGSAAYQIQLPAISSSLIGAKIEGYVGANGFKLRIRNSDITLGTVYLNNQSGAKQATIPANSYIRIVCVSATQWILTATDYAGAAVSTITPTSF